MRGPEKPEVEVKEALPEPTVTRRFRTVPFEGGQVRAPSLNRAVSADPLTPRTPEEQALFPTEFGNEEYGFQMPDMQEPFRDIEAEQMEQGLDTNALNLKGNVRLRLGDMYFQSDAFQYQQESGQIAADGNVQIQQRNSTLTADSLHYAMPNAEDLPEPLIFEPAYTEDQIQEKRLRLGRVQAQGLHIVEPTRELMADEFEYDLLSRDGEVLNARGRAGVYYFYAEKLKITGPNSFEAEELWLTTCECDFNDPDNPPPYRIKMKHVTIRDGRFVSGSHARLQFGRMDTPLYLPIFRQNDEDAPWTIDFDTGRRAEVGSFLNIGQLYRINQDLQLGPRLYLTQSEGIGFGADAVYDYSETPSSRLFLTKGEAHTLYTTKDRGYLHWYHNWKYSDDLQAKVQLEHWSDSDFYKDFYFDTYRNRTTPRSFANITYRQPGYIAEGNVSVNTHGWVRESERLPEASFTVPERSIAERLYLSFNTATGYYNREPSGDHGGRGVASLRLSYDINLAPVLNLTPFIEGSGAYYTDDVNQRGSESWASALVGVTAQTRLQREYAGFMGFSGFKHIVLPSLTVSHRPDVHSGELDIPFYDAYDQVSGRTRIESKLDNIFLGKDAETGEVWQVGRLTLYQGNDFWNETQQTEDYEIEFDVRPRPWWGMQVVGERHLTEDDFSLDRPYYLESLFVDTYARLANVPFGGLELYDLNSLYSDYDRVLAQIYYDAEQRGGRFNSRVGFAYTETLNRVFNREVLYGVGYRINEQWSVAFEHSYDFEDDELRTQNYEIRRIWDCWETAIRFRDRESGFDINFEIALTAIPGTKLKL